MSKHEKTKSVAKRFARAAVCAIIGIAATMKTSNPAFIFLSPVLQAVGKYLRIKWGMKNIPF